MNTYPANQRTLTLADRKYISELIRSNSVSTNNVTIFTDWLKENAAVISKQTGGISRKGNDCFYILDDYMFINETEDEYGEMKGHVEGTSALYRSDISGENKELIYHAEEGFLLSYEGAGHMWSAGIIKR